MSAAAAGPAGAARVWPLNLLALCGLLLVWILFYAAGWGILQFRESAPVASTTSAVPSPERT